MGAHNDMSGLRKRRMFQERLRRQLQLQELISLERIRVQKCSEEYLSKRQIPNLQCALAQEWR